MLPFVLTERDAMTNLGFLVGHLEEKLYKLATETRGPGLEVQAGDEDFDPNPGSGLYKGFAHQSRRRTRVRRSTDEYAGRLETQNL